MDDGRDDQRLLEDGELGMSFVAWKDGREEISLHGGFADREKSRIWTDETIAPVWSASKGPMAVSLLMAPHGAGLIGWGNVGAQGLA